jgi:hypothetical protein
VKKVQTKTYKGFSIGGKVTERDELNKSVIKGLKLIEVSLVDRPRTPKPCSRCTRPSRRRRKRSTNSRRMLDAGDVTPQQLVELAKAAKAGETPAPAPKVTPETATETVAKGMYDVAELARTLSNVMYLMESAMSEAAWEGDNSPIPAKLKDWLSAGGEILKEMVAEEVSEMTGGDGDEVVIELRRNPFAPAQGRRAHKAGAALSAKNKAHIDAIHKACVALGACEGAEKSAHADDLKKAQKRTTTRWPRSRKLLVRPRAKCSPTCRGAREARDDCRRRTREGAGTRQGARSAARARQGTAQGDRQGRRPRHPVLTMRRRSTRSRNPMEPSTTSPRPSKKVHAGQ